MVTENCISKETADSVTGKLAEIATLMNTMRKNANDDVIVETLTQKAGWLADRCLAEMGDTQQICGTFEAWSAAV